jgi:hypothetical protein
MEYKRGIKAHDSIVGLSLQTVKAGGKGRNKDLIVARNICMAYRYYYYVHLIRFRYDLVLMELQKEFYLTPETIPRIVEKHIDLIKKMTVEKVTVRQLKTKYPHMSWHHKPQTIVEKRAVFTLS